MQTPANEDEATRNIKWFHEVEDEGAVTFRAGRVGRRLVAEWPGLAKLACTTDGTEASFDPGEGAPASVLDKLRCGSVRALLRDLTGALSLHASAVAIEGRAILFVGESGSGKSTAAAEMCMRNGAELLADDVTLLEVSGDGVHVLPSEGEHWLTADSYLALGVEPADPGASTKFGHRAMNVAHEPRRLASCVALGFDASGKPASLRRLRGAEAAGWLLRAAFRFDVDDPRARRRELEQIRTVYDAVPFFEWVRPPAGPAAALAEVPEALRMMGR